MLAFPVKISQPHVCFGHITYPPVNAQTVTDDLCLSLGVRSDNDMHIVEVNLAGFSSSRHGVGLISTAIQLINPALFGVVMMHHLKNVETQPK
jgi:hypothetical protein